jgi:hypothetical protein
MVRPQGGTLARAFLLAAIAALAGAGAVHADVGVAIDIGKITVDQRLAKGGSYQLPVIGVRNPGSEPSTYRMGVTYIEGQPERRPSANWFSFSPSQFSLEPGATQPVRIGLDIPPNAAPDDYAALIQAEIAPEGVGAQVGAAAASQVSFTVEPSTILEAWLLRVRRELEEMAPWSYLLPPLVAVTASAWWLRRRFRLDVRVERRR